MDLWRRLTTGGKGTRLWAHSSSNSNCQKLNSCWRSSATLTIPLNTWSKIWASITQKQKTTWDFCPLWRGTSRMSHMGPLFRFVNILTVCCMQKTENSGTMNTWIQCGFIVVSCRLWLTRCLRWWMRCAWYGSSHVTTTTMNEWFHWWNVLPGSWPRESQGWSKCALSTSKFASSSVFGFSRLGCSSS